MQEFISEDDLGTFEGWSRYQGIDAATLTSDELAEWRGMFDEGRKHSLATPKVGLMKLQVPGEHCFAAFGAVQRGLPMTYAQASTRLSRLLSDRSLGRLP